MADPEGESLESWLNKATNPSNRQEDWEYIIGFCDQINKELEGPQISVRLLAHKIHSPQEWEALQALTVLEACMKNCGRRFHNEVGKFRFLNELIKVVSPKYLGDRVSEIVKKKVIEMLFSWSVALPDETKIAEAYQMLKRQGIVTTDPEVPADKTLIPSPPDRPLNPVFENEEKSKRLAELLKSKKPEDLQEANRLIKNMVKEDETRAQKNAQRTSTLMEVNNSVKLLNEMLQHFNKEQSTQEDKELLKDLHDDCDKLRTTVFKLATETEDDDSSLGEILQASDDLSRVINSYKNIVEGHSLRADTSASPASERTNNGSASEILIDLAGLDLQTPSPQHPPLPPAHIPPIPDDLFTSPPAFEPLRPCPNSSSAQAVFQISVKDNPTRPITNENPSSLSLLDEELISLGEFYDFVITEIHVDICVSVGLKKTKRCCVLGVMVYKVFKEQHQCSSGKESPVTAYDKDGVCVLLHFASECPPGRPDVLVMVVSMLNTAPLSVKNLTLQAAVPKSMRVKLQPPSSTELAPFNPILPPSAITQVMLLANPMKEKVRMRYKLTFVLGDRQCTETGEVDAFPPVEKWGRL
uniref:Golgi associated, gamma adaptin ear containing, ARF binding protein 3 n=1 Tax=Astyanax mexicanus TaxID=7994 RepID=A0A8B9LXQ9_ASTMX